MEILQAQPQKDSNYKFHLLELEVEVVFLPPLFLFLKVKKPKGGIMKRFSILRRVIEVIFISLIYLEFRDLNMLRLLLVLTFAFITIDCTLCDIYNRILRNRWNHDIEKCFKEIYRIEETPSKYNTESGDTHE